MLRAALNLLLWPVGAYLFVGATVFIVAFLMLAGGVWDDTLAMLFVPGVVIAIVVALSNMASERLDLHDIEILVLVNLSTWALPMAFLLIGLYLVPDWAQPLAWAVGFLLGGAAWVVVIEQTAHMDEPKQPPTRRQLLKHPRVRCMLRRIAAEIKTNRLYREIHSRAERLLKEINERGRREKLAAFWIAIATVLALFLMVLSWTILGFSRQEELLEEWMAEIFAVWYSVLAAGLSLTSLALFWHAIWWRLLRGGVKLLLWLVGAYFFVSATTAIQDCLMLCGEGWNHVLAMVFVPIAAIAIAGTAAELILERFKPSRTQIMVFAAVSLLFGVAVLFIPLVNVADGWQQVLTPIWAAGALISGAGWMAAIEPRAQTEKRTRRLSMRRRAVKLAPWPVGAFFFVLADTFIQISLMLGSEGWNHVLVILFAPVAAIAIARALAEGVSGIFMLGAMKITALAGVSLLIWIAFVHFGNLADGWRQALILAVGFLVSGAGWRAAGEQMANMDIPKSTPRRSEYPTSTNVRAPFTRGQWAVFGIAMATMIVLWLAATLLEALRLIASEEWMPEIPAVWYWVLAGVLSLATLALFWHAIWNPIWRVLPGWLKAHIQRRRGRGDGRGG